ncbi:hypothetical protein [Streptomyces sp. W1SF4]|uniref:hypothetical protein n=1 Tax=Streptomyces sp. W1SF4 TaxID=2305220 RepID=UPI000F70B0B4|nr:hypothetical protein [Streptomyces sp. W1SF4]AZM87895.1 hypothetical protein D1J60_04815 [Streptomyces sp. W1SF4]
MQNHASSNERIGDAGITTEDIAHPMSASEAGTDTGADAESGGASADGRTPPVYPGEATTDAAAEGRDARDSGDGPPTDRGSQAGVDDPLLGAEDTAEYHKAWSEIQGRFVDDPQEAVRSADALVAEVMQTLARSFSAHKQGLEEQWGQGGQVATEDLRLALQHYRSFFNRLLNT